MKKLIAGLGLAGALLAGCGGGSDTLSNVVGPNPISDAHAAYDRFHDSGWTDAREAALAQRFYDEYSSRGVTMTQANCITEYYIANFSYDDLTNQNRYPTASEEAAAEAAIVRCMS